MKTELDPTTSLLEDLLKQQQESLKHYFSGLNLAGFKAFYDTLSRCRGTLLFSGVGKSALVAKRIVQMLVSIGVSSRFLCATDALHGDLGSVGSDDVFIAMSKSGQTDELIALMPLLKGRVEKCLSMVSYPNSQIESLSDMTLILPLDRELCPFNLAPTTSSTLQMLAADTFIVMLMKERGLSKEVYAENHPAGLIGKRLYIRVEDLMLKEGQLPLVGPDVCLLDSLETFSQKNCGCLIVVDAEQKLLGIFTEGDLRRTLQKSSVDLEHLMLSDVMIKSPKVAYSHELAHDALTRMQSSNMGHITELPVVDRDNRVSGLIRLHHIARAGLCS